MQQMGYAPSMGYAATGACPLRLCRRSEGQRLKHVLLRQPLVLCRCCLEGGMGHALPSAVLPATPVATVVRAPCPNAAQAP